jgi:hypothetical protein
MRQENVNAIDDSKPVLFNEISAALIATSKIINPRYVLQLLDTTSLQKPLIFPRQTLSHPVIIIRS